MISKDKLLQISEYCFRIGIIFTAILLPVEILPNRAISIASLLISVLIIQYPCLSALAGKTELFSFSRLRIGITIVVPFLAFALSFLVNPQDGSFLVLRTFGVLIFRSAIVAAFAETKHLRVFENSTLWVAGAVVLFGYFQFFGDIFNLPSSITLLKDNYSSSGSYLFPRVHSFAREPLLLANYLFIPLAFLIIRYRKAQQRATILMILPIIVLLLLLNSRGAFIGILSMAILLIAATRPRIRTLGIGLAGAGIALLSGFVTVYIFFGGHTLISFVKHATEFADASFSNRLATWPAAFQAIKEHPFFGFGPGSGGTVIAGHLGWVFDKSLVFNNTYATVLAEAGIIGVVSFMWLLVTLVNLIRTMIGTRLNDVTSAYGLIFAAWLFQIATFEALLNLRLWFVIGFALAAYRISKTDRKPVS